MYVVNANLLTLMMLNLKCCVTDASTHRRTQWLHLPVRPVQCTSSVIRCSVYFWQNVREMTNSDLYFHYDWLHCKLHGEIGGLTVIDITLSHTHTVVRECCKGHDASQRRSPKFDPPLHPNPVSDSHKNWQRWLRHGPRHLCKNSSRSAPGFHFRECLTLCTKSVYSASFIRLSIFSILATCYSQGFWTDFDVKYARTRGSAQVCAFLGSWT